MSAFLMSEKFFDQLASDLFAHATLQRSKLNWAINYVLDLRGQEFNRIERKIREFVTACYTLNVASVNDRYDSDYPLEPLSFTRASGVPKWSDEQLFKHLECLSYQCADVKNAEQHETYQKLEKLIGHVARAIVGGSDRYEEAQWDYAA